MGLLVYYGFMLENKARREWKYGFKTTSNGNNHDEYVRYGRDFI